MASKKAALPALKLSFPAGQALNEDRALCLRQAGVRLLAAFDGCGGVGGRRYPQLENRTGAYIASGLYAQSLETWFQSHVSELPSPQTAQELDTLFLNAARDFYSQYLSASPTAVTGSMVRTLPSTAAIFLQYKDQATLYWAGNTRGYLLTGQGLRQLSADDCSAAADAFTSLYTDAPINNYLCADKPFNLREVSISLPTQGVLVLATDGAYHALPTPMHFEALLLDTLAGKNSKKQWKQALKEALQANAADDITLVLQPFGFQDYSELAPHFDKRRRHVQQAYILPAAQASTDARLALQTLWDMYRKESR